MATNYTNGLLTGGLGIGIPACAMIMTANIFTIGPCMVTITVKGDIGGSRPLAPGEIGSFYQPVAPELQPFKPEVLDKMYTPYQVPVLKDQITIRIKLGDKEIERQYLVRKNRRKIIINVLNLINNTKERMHVTAKNIKTVFHKAVVRITNFKNHK